MLILAADSLKRRGKVGAEANTLTQGRSTSAVFTHTWKPDLVCLRCSPAHAPASRARRGGAVRLGKTSKRVWKMSRLALSEGQVLLITARPTGTGKPHAVGKIS